MNAPSLPRPLQGIIPPLVTPLVDEDQIDAGGTQRLLEHLIDGGVHGVFILGTTGEGTSLHPRVRQQFVELVCEVVAGRIPVLVGITDTNLRSAVELAEQSYAAGAGAVVTAAPYYLPMTQSDLIRYIEVLADELPLPLLLYNMPSCTKTAFAVESVRELRSHNQIIGVKDTSHDLAYFSHVAKLAGPDFTVLMGPEEKLAESIERGGLGGVTGGANMFPELYVGLYHAAVAGDAERVAQLQAVVMRISNSIYQVSDSGARVLQGIKAGLAELGICSGVVAEPFRTYDRREQAQVATAVREILPLVQKFCSAERQLTESDSSV